MDRLSDDVICHILSFLSTQVSISTSILARRWRFLWTQVPNLVMDEYQFPTGDGSEEPADIINKVVALHRSETINTFSLIGKLGCNDHQLDAWITHALSRGVRKLCILVTFYKMFTLPKRLLTCETLVDLELSDFKGFPCSGDVFLPRLKSLYLSGISFDDDEALPHLLSGCPALEHLILHGFARGKRYGCLFVSSQTLKTLDLDFEEFGCGVLKMDAPSLVRLEAKNCFLDELTSLRTMTSLIEAHIMLIGDYVQNTGDTFDSNDSVDVAVLQFLNCLCNLKRLKISIYSAQRFVSIVGFDRLVKFGNLTKLEFDLKFDFHELVKFLEVADNLRVLTFTLGGMDYTYREPRLVPTCMLSRLKTVSVRINLKHGFNENDFETIRYLLRNAQVLKRLEVHSYPFTMFNREQLGMLGRITPLKRGSDSCQLAFIS